MPLNAGQVIKRHKSRKILFQWIYTKSEKVQKSCTQIIRSIFTFDKSFQNIIKTNIQCKKFYIGEEVAPKCYKTNYIDQDGELQEKLNKIYGRKTTLKTIVKNEIDRLEKAGVVRHTNYIDMTEEVEQFCKLMSEPGNIENARDTTSEGKRVTDVAWPLRYIWITLIHVSFMSCFLYDPFNFLTDEEFKQRNPEKKKKWRAVIHWKTRTLHFWIIW